MPADPGSDRDPLTSVTTYVYDSVGRVISARYPRGVVTSTTYDANGRLIGPASNSPPGGNQPEDEPPPDEPHIVG